MLRASVRLHAAQADLASGIQPQAGDLRFSYVQGAELPVYGRGGGAGLHPLGAADSSARDEASPRLWVKRSGAAQVAKSAPFWEITR
jgi:hypothetical protein